MNQQRLRAEIIAVGSELLEGGRLESNSAFLAGRLATVGARVRRKWVVGDSPDDIAQAVTTALEQGCDILLLSGGLGPTNDDLTREAVAQALGRPLQTVPELEDRLKKLYARFNVKMSDNNLRQAQVIAGGEAIENPKGSAPGMFLREKEALVFLLPGPPRELEPMVDNQVLPRIRQDKPGPALYRRTLKVLGLPESTVDARVEDAYRQFEDVETTILSSSGIISLHFTWTGEDHESRANQALDALLAKARQALGQSVYAEDDAEPEEILGRLLRQRGETLATAESCTGGWMGQLITAVAGSSDYYVGGYVTYSNALKVDTLGVNETTLERFGAVSRQVAEQMAAGARNRSGADYALSTTGIAGPGGGSEEKPVGLVWVGLAAPEGVESKRLQLPGDRNWIRLRSARLALDLLRRRLM
ncbi:MAG TPA: competence/damage-inducible protein A [Acidobacteriota bacterium]|nr:competence/damage-inducible protein A [Acidobacteriota bacterium]